MSLTRWARQAVRKGPTPPISASRTVAFWFAAAACLVAFALFLLPAFVSATSVFAVLLGGYSEATLVEIDPSAEACYYELADSPGTWHEAGCPPNAEPFRAVRVFVDGSALAFLDDDSLFGDEETTGNVSLARSEAVIETLFLIGASLAAGLVAYLLRALARRIDARP